VPIDNESGDTSFARERIGALAPRSHCVFFFFFFFFASPCDGGSIADVGVAEEWCDGVMSSGMPTRRRFTKDAATGVEGIVGADALLVSRPSLAIFLDLTYVER